MVVEKYSFKKSSRMVARVGHGTVSMGGVPSRPVSDGILSFFIIGRPARPVP